MLYELCESTPCNLVLIRQLQCYNEADELDTCHFISNGLIWVIMCQRPVSIFHLLTRKELILTTGAHYDWVRPAVPTVAILALYPLNYPTIP